MNKRIETANHNVDLLQRRGFHKERNTTIFKNGCNFILSPGVSEGTNGKYWFDIREVNLNRITPDSFLLVRIVPDLFVLENLKSLSPLLSPKMMGNRPHSGNVWGIHIDLNPGIPGSKAHLFNQKSPIERIATDLLNKTSLNSKLDEIGI